ncbi:Ig-like domain-containing protein [Wenyingzhuangia sp. chi5]|uniref:Ig-like domain-containing protein n=1 Tax=Wenyingzhuangia gilva TaxID=3057677 RepID=A0ABT8VPA0_9FLAO|nr:Ig-like domain-containing protein [Wenyingzhuangia sp. chi5]MDO3693815.1 Ig-like domain-containing protein [Wenyingzhuangia sp. chi5]
MKNILAILIVIVTLFLGSCARMGSPTGGPKDSIPPVMAIAKPANKTTSFNAEKIVIVFDEYIKFEKLNSQLIISPPMEKKPIIKPEVGVSKKISIEFLEPLTPNTTYTINFGNSIIDNNEGNKLGKFSYVFSTGPLLDSLSISGNVIDPLTDKKIENISVMAYKNANDTLVGHYTPNYLSNTLDSTYYSLENLSEANYKLIALEDKNNNYKYDKGLERIAFLNQDIDLKAADTIDDFILFKEPRDNKIMRPTQTSGHVIILGYQGKDIPEVSASGIAKNNYFVSKPSSKDSLYFWFKEFPKDSITINIKQDTLFESFTRMPRDLKMDSLIVKSTIKGTLHPNDSLILSSNIPIDFINKDSIQVLEQDSIPIDYTITNNAWKQSLLVDFKRQPNKYYSLVLKELAFTDILHQYTGKQIVKLKTVDLEEYGDIILDVKNPNNLRLLIEISNDSFKTKTVQIIDDSQEVSFKQLPPGEYHARVIQDLNKNNKFDNGNFELRIQPEPINNLNKKLTLRANSEINETITIK